MAFRVVPAVLMLSVLHVADFSLNHCIAQDQEKKRAQSVLVKVASSREAIVQYVVELSFETDRKAGTGRRIDFFNGKARIYYSRLDDYKVLCLSEGKPETKSPWAVRGWSRGCIITGTVDAGRVGKGNIKFIDPDKGPSSSVKEQPAFFDPLSAGFGFCGDFKLATPFSKLLTSFAAEDFMKVKTDKDEITISCIDGKVVIDKSKGYSVIRSEFQDPASTKESPTTWDIELQEVDKGVWLPSKVVFECLGEKTRIQYSWISVNEPMDVGVKGAQSVAADLGGGFLVVYP